MGRVDKKGKKVLLLVELYFVLVLVHLVLIDSNGSIKSCC